MRGDEADRANAAELLLQLPEGPVATPRAGLVKAAASSWVHRVVSGSETWFCKTYSYPTLASRLRALPRTLVGERARGRREYDACRWFRAHGFEAPRPLAVGEWRHHGLLARSLVIAAAWPGEDLESLLPRLDAAARDDAARALHALVRSWHTLGYRDRNLDLRNLLARRDGDRWRIAKIDSPRWCLRASDHADRLAAADWARLLPQLRAAGVSAALAAPPT